MNYDYKELIKDLNMGREIEFIYNHERYYIGYGRGKSMFWRFNDSTSEIEGENVEDLLQKIKLDGKLIIEVWDLIKIDIIF
ncbi:hypothetical protein [Metabacillus fastidiosus]|uniref:hypothetical protein n=1 Tax=Metabacillus fastidiosus TaxID=1458 RepID=UPI003D2A12C5